MRSQRQFKNFLLQPGKQIRYAVGIFMVVLLCFGYLNFSVLIMFDKLLTHYAELLEVKGDYVQELAGYVGQLKLIFVVSMIILSIASFTLGIFITHRFIGPTVPMLKFIDELIGGNYSARGSLRKNDELQDVMDGLNELAENLEKKMGKGGEG